MADNKTADDGLHTSRMEDILLERERLDQVLRARFRKKLAVLFSDICGYTQFTEKRGDIQGRTLLLNHNRLVLPAIEKQKGKVAEIIGDGIMAAFEDPVDAGRAAVEIQQELKAYNDRLEPDDQIHLRIGINCGEAMLDETAAHQSITGDVANVAARILNQAAKDQILISQSVADALRSSDDFLIRFQGNVQVKGKTDKISVYRIIWGDEEIGTKLEGVDVTRPASAVKAEGVSTIINLDLNLESDRLKIGINETRPGEASTISRYDTTRISMHGIDTRCRQLVDTLNKANRQGRVTRQVLVKLREIGQLLYDDLLTFDIKELLRNTRADTLILTIDDQLVHIPWELLYDGRSFLCMRFIVGRVVKTRQPIASIIHRKLEQPLNMLLLADPTGDLKGAYAEGIQIRDFLDQSPDLLNVTLRSNDITLETIQTKLRNFDIVHFAGHSDYKVDSPETSGWRLQGGSLCPGDINKMAGSAVMPAMIFANACQSARTEQQQLQTSFENKIFGLANAFLVAGVKHYIGTFWEVPDEASSRFAIEFYKHLFSRLSVGEALRKARQAVIDLYGEETIVWASYVLYGDPSFDYMANLEMAPPADRSVETTGTVRGFPADRTREEVIDFSEPRRRTPTFRRWVTAGAGIALILAACVWFYGWRADRQVAKDEHQAMALYLSGDADAAAQLCRKVQHDRPGSPLSCLILGNLSFGQGDREAARGYFQAVADSGEAAPQLKSEALLGLGRVYSMEQQPQKALQLYQSAATADPRNARPLVSQAVVLEDQNRGEEALRLYDQAVAKFPQDREIQVAAQDLKDRLSLQQDQARQARIDELVQELLKKMQATPSPSPPTESWTSKPLSLWLMPFEEEGFSLQEGQSRMVHLLVRDRLIANPRVRQVERDVLDKLLSELRLGSSQLAEPGTALTIGRLMAARVLLPGQVQYDNEKALFSIRAIECETGLISASVVGTYGRLQSATVIAEDLALKMSRELRARFPIRAKVTHLDGQQVHLDIGQNLNLQKGQYFKGVDADALVQITSVDSSSSTAKVIEGQDAFYPGFKLEEQEAEDQG